MVLLVLAALVASAALFVDYLKPAPVFCEEGGGCGAVKQTIFAHVYGVPTPAIGLFGMAIIGLSLLSAVSWAPAITLLVSSFGALIAAYLISVQARMGVYCVYCMTFDTVMVLLPFLAAIRLRISAGAKALPVAPPFGWRAGAGGVLVLGALTPALVGHFRKPHVPDAILKEMEATPAGKVTIVDFVDFQCPYCRMMHATLGPLIARDKDRIRMVRKNVPLTRIHIHADIAARAEVCGEKLSGNGPPAQALVERLFSMPEDDLVQDNIVAAAQEVGLDAAAFTSCLTDPATDARLAEDAAAFKSVGGRGLPLLYIGAHRLEGAQDGPAVDAALRQAEATR
jgi:predicted DsbA family dithiol-disulfide isomerase/uncharacterized membrane protein